MKKNRQKYSIILLLILIAGLNFNLSAQDTFLFEAEDYDIVDPDDTDGTYVVVDDPTASAGKFLHIAVGNKSKKYAGYSFTTTSSTDTTYYVWLKVRSWNGTSDAQNGKTFVNWSIPDSIIARGGTTLPSQSMTYNMYDNEIAEGDTEVWKWFMLTAPKEGTPTELHMPPGAHNFLFRARIKGHAIDQLKITNDLNWRPDITYEWEAEKGNVTEPLIVENYSGASNGQVVSAPEGSGTITQIDLMKGNADIIVAMRRAPGDYYVWLLVDLPSESSNSYWIGTGDQQLMPPSWEGSVTNGLEWQLVQENGVAKVFPLGLGNWHNGVVVRVKQQEEGTKIDKILVTNDINFNPVTSIDASEGSELLPKSFSVSQNYPNPFNPSTTITYALPKAGEVEVSVYNIMGQKVTVLVNEYQSAGVQNVTWDAGYSSGSASGGLSSGIYFYSVKYGDKITNKKMLLLK